MKPVVVVMGVSGCGKSTVGKMISKELKIPFFDADDFHSPANVQKMKEGRPLDDADRKPWLYLLSELLSRESENGVVLACSALKKEYRRILSSIVNPTFVYLSLTKEQAKLRVTSRNHHFMPADLITSQFEALEPPEKALTVDASADLDKLVAYVSGELKKY